VANTIPVTELEVKYLKNTKEQAIQIIGVYVYMFAYSSRVDKSVSTKLGVLIP
jgi:hypothetical protein